ncbi:hemolysin-type calcium-binding region [Geminocystis sp. NIES-3708]|uniref:cadherin-like domain-containing protein n=1 Tax=Geminocystis sp. NIES-3708 TaxID=1615909 RepID=UPI0005FC74D1|nr:cadherin-like domain-containing protein [Geminocystis sp. NIES-3708]BAQ62666.1 hemolysin-type calcium-binding region [Geminocystis sp. NIES-3708]
MTITINDSNSFSYIFNEDSLLNLTTINISGTSTTLTVTLIATNGNINIGSTTNLSNVSVSGNTISFQGLESDVNNALATLSYDSDNNYNGSASLNIDVNDGSNSTNQNVSFSITPVNDAPDLISTSTLNLTVDEDNIPVGAVGSLISDFNGNISDIDSVSSLKSIAITNVSSDITLYYSLDNGTNWTIASALSNSSALLLADDGVTRIYVVNNTSNFNGSITDGLTFRAWDQTTGFNGTLADTTTNGNDTAFSTTTDTIDINVISTNDAPTRIGNINAPNLTPISVEDQNPNTISGDTINNIFSAKFSDLDGDSFGGVAVVTNDASFFQGDWQWSNDGVNWITIEQTFIGFGGTVSGLTLNNALLLNKDTKVRFLPFENFNGTPEPLTVRLVDDSISIISGNRVDLSDLNATGDKTPYSDVNNEITLTTTVTGINDAPLRISDEPIIFTPTNEDNSNPSGQSISSLFNSQFDDFNDSYSFFGGSNQNNLAGIAIVKNNAVASEGTWEWSNNGSTWNSIPFNLSNNNALVLSANTFIRFVPALNYNGNVGSLTSRLIDDSSGAVISGSTLDFANVVSGGTTAYSDENNTVQLKTSVTPINDAPTRDVTKPDLILLAQEDTANSGTATVSTLFATGFLDTADAQNLIGGLSTSNQFAGVAIVQNEATVNGTWQYSTNGTTWTNISTTLIPTNALVLNKDTLIRFLINTPNFNGNIGKLTARLLDNSSGEVVTGTTLDVNTIDGTAIYSNSSNQVLLFGSITPINDIPTINPVSLIVNEGGSGTFSNSGNFNLADIDNVDQQLIIKIASLPTKGILTFNGRQVVVGSTLSADQIPQLQYVHSGNQVLIQSSDSFNITAEDGAGGLIALTPIPITINPVNQDPSAEGEETLYEGQTGVIVPITISDPDQAVGIPHDIKILTLPTQGKLKVNGIEIISIPMGGLMVSSTDAITYDHNGNEPIGNDSFNVEIIDDGGGTGFSATTVSTISLNIIPNNDDPFLVNNTGTSLDINTGREITVDSAMLQVDDPDSSISQLTYTLTDIPNNGYLLYDDNGTKKRLLVGATFTQADINNGIISYRFFESGTGIFNDSFSFQVRDSEITSYPVVREGGIYDGATLETITFPITVEDNTERGFGEGGETFPDRGPTQPPTEENNQGVGIINSPAILDEASSIVITDTLLKFIDPDNLPEEVIFRLAELPTSGILKLDGVALRVFDSFTQKDITDGLLTFEHDGNEDFIDNFKFTISDGSNIVTNSGNPFIFEIDVTPKNDQPIINVSGKPFVREGGTTGIAPDSSLSTYITLSDVDGSGEKSGEGFATVNNLTFKVLNLPIHGTLEVNQGAGFVPVTTSTIITKAQLDGNLFRYIHDGSENFDDSFDIQVDDNTTGTINNLSTITTVEIDISPINDPPVFDQKKDLIVLEGGTATIKGSNGITIDESRLIYQDPDNTSIQRQYVITTDVEYGTLFLNGQALGLNSVFTQNDLDNDRITYKHDGSENHDDEFLFTVRDGAGGSVDGNYQIKVTPRNDRPTIDVPSNTLELFDNIALNITGIIPSDIDIIQLNTGVSNSVEVDRLRITLNPLLNGSTYQNGVLNLTTINGITFINPASGLPYPDQNNTNNGSTNYGNKLIIEGTLAELQSAVNTLTYQLDPNANSDVNGTIELKITVDDRIYDPNTGSVTASNGGFQNQNGSAFNDLDNTAFGTIKIQTSNENNPPQVTTSKNNTSFATFINEDQATLLNGQGNNPTKIIIIDEDAFGSNVRVTLTVANGIINLSNSSLITGGANGSQNITLTGNLTDINNVLEGLSYNPSTDYNNFGTSGFLPTNNLLTVVVNDLGNSGVGGPKETTRDIYLVVRAVNDAPTRIDANPIITTVPEDTIPTGNTVLSLFNPKFNDQKDNQTASSGSGANSLAGIAIVGNTNDPTQGKWQWSINGTLWTDISNSPNLSSSLLLSSNTLIRFLPVSDFQGTPSGQLTTRLIDSSSGVVTSGGSVNLSATNATGGTTRYSDLNNEVILQTIVSPINDAPIATTGTVSITTIAEDTTPTGTQLLGLLNSQYDDQQKDNQTNKNGNNTATPLTYVAIVGSTNYVAGQGAWEYSDGGTGWINIPVSGLSDSRALIIPSDRQIRFVPAPNFFGTPGTLSVKLADGSSVLTTSNNSTDNSEFKNLTLTTNGGIGTTGSWSVNNVTISTNITTVNDAPSINNPNTVVNLTAIDEDNTDPTGETVLNLFSSKYNDTIDNQQAITGGGKADTNFAGIAVVANASTSGQGKWQYNTGGGWLDLPILLSDSNALVLTTTDQLRFVPALNYYGDPGQLTVRVSDGTGFTAGVSQNINAIIGTKTDGSGGWSSDTTDLATTVNPINDTPVLNGTTGTAQTTIEDANPVAVGTNLTGISDIEIGLNQLPDLVTATVTIGNFFAGDLLTFTLPSGVTATANGTGDVYTLSGSGATLVNILSALQSTTYVSTSNNPTNIINGNELNPTRTIQYQINDTQSINNLSNVITTTVEYTEVFNDAPSLENASFVIDEDPAINVGQTIDTLFTGKFSDPDGPSASLSGIAIISNTANGTTEGTWQYSTVSNPNETDWFAIGTVGDDNITQALALSKNTLVRFVPVLNYNGTPPALQVRALDDTYSNFTNASTRVNVNTSVNGGQTAIAANPSTLAVTVNPVNDTPIISGNTGARTYTENNSSIILVTASGAIVDVDTNNFPNGTLTISLNNYLTGDVLSVNNQGTGNGQIGLSGNNITFAGTTIGTTSGGNANNLVITLNANADKTAIQALLDNLTYRSTSDDPTNVGANPSRTFNVTFNDGGNIGSGGPLNSNILSGTINVIAVNDDPVNSVPTTQTTPEDTTRIFNSTNNNRISISDVDAGNQFVSVTLTVANGIVNLSGVSGLTFQNSTSNGSNNIQVTGTITNINNALNGLSFSPTANYNNNFSTGSITVVTNDLGNTDALANQNKADSDTIIINITPVNDAPIISLVASPVTGTYTEGQTAFNVGQNIAAIADIEIDQNEPTIANNFTSTVTITDFFTGDILDFTLGSTGVVVINPSNGVYTLNGTKANVLQVLQTTTYFSSSDNPTNYNTNFDRVITYRINDNQSVNNLSNIVSTTVNITPENDPPVVTASNGVTTFIEGNNVLSTPVIVDSGLILDDVDNLTLASATVSITNFLPEDILVFTNNPSFGNITASYVNGVLTLSSVGQTATLTQWQNALRSITYTNSSDIPNNLDRTITITINDGQANSISTTRTVQVVPVNDTPILSAGSIETYAENASLVAIAPTMTLTNADTDLLVYNNGSSLTINYSSGGTSNDQLSISDGNGITISGTDVLYNGNIIGTFSGGVNGTGLTITFDGIDSSGLAVQTLLNNISFSNNSDDPIGGNRVFEITINDNEGNDNGGWEFAISSTTVNLIPVNDAPSFTNNATLTAIKEDYDNDLNTIQGEQINILFNGFFNDADISTNPFLSGLAVIGNTANATTEGAWQYSTNNGLNWFDIGNVNDSGNALVLSATTKIRFVPTANYNTNIFVVPPLQVRALDNTYSSGFTNGSTRIDIDTTNNGGTTAIAGGTNTIETSVIPVNDIPNLNIPGVQVLASGNIITFSASNSTPNAITIDDLLDFPYGADDNFTVTLTTTKNGNADGILTLGNGFTNNNNTITLTGTKNDINIALDGLTYSPFNSNSELSAILEVIVNDNANGGTAISGLGDALTATGEIIINVSNINEPPVFTNPLPSTIIATEDTPFGFTGNSLISFDDPDDFDNNLKVTLSVTNGKLTLGTLTGINVTNGANGSNNLTFQGTETDLNAALASLIYQGNQDYNTLGSNKDVFSIIVDDLGNTGVPIPNTDPLLRGQININVTPVNDAPVANPSVTIPPVNQDNINPPLNRLPTLLSSSYDDSKDQVLGGSSSTPLRGIAIVRNNADPAQGKWQYSASTLAYELWNDIPLDSSANKLSTSSALILNNYSTVKLRFLPNPQFNGTPTNQDLEVYLSDGLGFSASSTVSDRKDISGDITNPINGWSNDSILISTTINKINTPPIINDLDGDIFAVAPNGTTKIDQVTGTGILAATITDVQGLKIGGQLTISLDAFGVNNSGDQLSIATGGNISVVGNVVSVNGTAIGTINSINNGTNGKSLTINFTKDLTPAEGNTLIQNITYQASNTVGIRAASFTVTDGQGGTSNTATAYLNVTSSTIPYGPPILGDVNGQVRSDILKGTSGNDIINGKGSNDILYGYNGDDLMMGGDANDRLDAAAGNDILLGGSGDDALLGGNDNDILVGGDGKDNLTGGNGNDYLNGGFGSDTITGGAGADMFDYRELKHSFLGTVSNVREYDLIMDFNVSQGDKILTSRAITSFNTTPTTMTSLTHTAVTSALSSLGSNSAALVKFGTRTFLAINDDIPAFDANNDTFVEFRYTATTTAPLNINVFSTL